MFNTFHTLFETHPKNAWILRSHLE
jgi:hypothetical protein